MKLNADNLGVRTSLADPPLRSGEMVWMRNHHQADHVVRSRFFEREAVAGIQTSVASLDRKGDSVGDTGLQVQLTQARATGAHGSIRRLSEMRVNVDESF